MELILLQDVEKVGRRGDLIQVRDGFGRNFLIPRSLAVPATPENRAAAEVLKKRAAAREVLKKGEAAETAERLQSLHLRIEAKVGDKDRLFGSVTAQDLSKAFREKGIPVDKRQIRLSEPLRTLGSHTVTVELAPEIKPTVSVEIVKKK